MPTTRAGRSIAAGYLLAVLISTVLWLVQGAYSPWVWITVVLTLPLGFIAEGLLGVVAMAMVVLPEALGTAILGAVVLAAFPGLAVANVVMGRAAWIAAARRYRACRLLHRAA